MVPFVVLLCFLTLRSLFSFFFFFFNDTATTEIYTLSLHDALPIWLDAQCFDQVMGRHIARRAKARHVPRSEEHTSELQSPCNLVCRLLLEKKKNHYRLYLAKDLPTRLQLDIAAS